MGAEEKEVRREEGGEGKLQRRDTKCEERREEGTEEVEELRRTEQQRRTFSSLLTGLL